MQCAWLRAQRPIPDDPAVYDDVAGNPANVAGYFTLIVPTHKDLPLAAFANHEVIVNNRRPKRGRRGGDGGIGMDAAFGARSLVPASWKADVWRRYISLDDVNMSKHPTVSSSASLAQLKTRRTNPNRPR
jgi:hypothetical protein